MPPLFIYPIRPRYWSSYKKKSRNPVTYRKEREPAYCEEDSSDIFLKKFKSPTKKKAQSQCSINACQINLKKNNKMLPLKRGNQNNNFNTLAQKKKKIKKTNLN